MNIAAKESFLFNRANDDKDVIDNLQVFENRIIVPFIDSPLSALKRIELRTDYQVLTVEVCMLLQTNDTSFPMNQFKFCPCFETDVITKQI